MTGRGFNMKKTISFLMILTVLLTAFGTVFATAEEVEMPAGEPKKYNIPTGIRLFHEPAAKFNGEDCEVKYKWSKNAIGLDNCIAEGDHTFTARAKLGDIWEDFDVRAFHVSADYKLPECTRDESKIDFGLHKLPPDWSKICTIGGCSIAGLSVLAIVLLIVLNKGKEQISF